MADRTQEFFALARAIPATGPMGSIRGGGGAGAPSGGAQTPGDAGPAPKQNPRDDPALAELRAFRAAASEISRDVSATSSMLAELTRLVKAGAGGTRMFADESANERADALVLRIKHNIEGLNSRLEDASRTLDRSKRRLGKNSQAGMEASNLVGQLKEDFVKTTSGFKAVLEERSDGMKDTTNRKRRVIGGGGGMDGQEGGEEERVDLLSLMNKPAVYGGEQRSSSFGGELSGGLGGGMAGGGPGGMPALDLTSGMMAMAQRHQEEMGGLPAGESSSQLPRPRELCHVHCSLQLGSMLSLCAHAFHLACTKQTELRTVRACDCATPTRRPSTPLLPYPPTRGERRRTIPIPTPRPCP